MGRDPQRIFSSDSGMDESHINRENFGVNVDDFSLTISNMDFLGAGRYTCRSIQADGSAVERAYNLAVIGTVIIQIIIK